MNLSALGAKVAKWPRALVYSSYNWMTGWIYGRKLRNTILGSRVFNGS
jgi:hypothetical protein